MTTYTKKLMCVVIGTNLFFIPCMIAAAFSFQTNSTAIIISCWLAFIILPQVVGRTLIKLLFKKNELSKLSQHKNNPRLPTMNSLWRIGVSTFAITMFVALAYLSTLEVKPIQSPLMMTTIILLTSLLTAGVSMGVNWIVKKNQIALLKEK